MAMQIVVDVCPDAWSSSDQPVTCRRTASSSEARTSAAAKRALLRGAKAPSLAGSLGRPSFFGLGGGTVVEMGSYPGPDVLDFAQVDISSSITNPFELLKHSCNHTDIVLAALRDFAQVTGELVADALGDVSEPGGRALVVPHIVGPPESVDHRASIECQFEQRGIDTVLITGTVTNVCSESSARDAATLGYRVIMVADANAARRDEDHNATLYTIYRTFGDVRPTTDVLELIHKS